MSKPRIDLSGYQPGMAIELPKGFEPSMVLPKGLTRREPPTMRERTLDAAKSCVCGGRDAEYGGPEDSFGRIAALWTAYLPGGSFTPVDVALMLALVKVARLAANPGHQDSWVDLAGYAACGSECAGGAG